MQQLLESRGMKPKNLNQVLLGNKVTAGDLLTKIQSKTRNSKYDFQSVTSTNQRKFNQDLMNNDIMTFMDKRNASMKQLAQTHSRMIMVPKIIAAFK